MNDHGKLRVIMHLCPTYVGIRCFYQSSANIVVVPCWELLLPLGIFNACTLNTNPLFRLTTATVWLVLLLKPNFFLRKSKFSTQTHPPFIISCLFLLLILKYDTACS